MFKRILMFYNQSDSDGGGWPGISGSSEMTPATAPGIRRIAPESVCESDSDDDVEEEGLILSSVSSSLFHSGYERELIQSVWEFAEVVSGNDPELWRKDEFGDWIYRLDYGRRTSEFGWEIFDPGIGRHAQGVYAMRPMQWGSYLRQYEAFS